MMMNIHAVIVRLARKTSAKRNRGKKQNQNQLCKSHDGISITLTIVPAPIAGSFSLRTIRPFACASV